MISEIPLDEIISYVARLPVHDLDKLSKSIERNGVRVPLIVLDDHTLLDGNRRFFAAHLLRMRKLRAKQPIPEVLERIPVWIVKRASLTPRQEMKILAEANFVSDLKVPWPDGAKAKTIQSYYKNCIAQGMEHEAAITEISEIFAISLQMVAEWLETLEIADDFTARASSERDSYARRRIVEERFVYFWEFRNKSKKGKAKLDEKEFPEVERMFFTLMSKADGFQNMKQIEPLIGPEETKSCGTC